MGTHAGASGGARSRRALLILLPLHLLLPEAQGLLINPLSSRVATNAGVSTRTVPANGRGLKGPPSLATSRLGSSSSSSSSKGNARGSRAARIWLGHEHGSTEGPTLSPWVRSWGRRRSRRGKTTPPADAVASVNAAHATTAAAMEGGDGAAGIDAAFASVFGENQVQHSNEEEETPSDHHASMGGRHPMLSRLLHSPRVWYRMLNSNVATAIAAATLVLVSSPLSVWAVGSGGRISGINRTEPTTTTVERSISSRQTAEYNSGGGLFGSHSNRRSSARSSDRRRGSSHRIGAASGSSRHRGLFEDISGGEHAVRQAEIQKSPLGALIQIGVQLAVMGVFLLPMRETLTNLAKGNRKAAVSELQIAFYCDRESGGPNVLTQLDELAGTADVSSPKGLAKLLEAACLVGLRFESDWVSSRGSFDVVHGKGKQGAMMKGDARFAQKVVSERSKWQEETVTADADGNVTRLPIKGKRGSNTMPTIAVLSLYVLWSRWGAVPASLKSKRKIRKLPPPAIQSSEDVKEFLSWLSGEASVGKGVNLQAVEVLWTPASPNDSLEKEELNQRWPELTPV